MYNITFVFIRMLSNLHCSADNNQRLRQAWAKSHQQGPYSIVPKIYSINLFYQTCYETTYLLKNYKYPVREYWKASSFQKWFYFLTKVMFWLFSSVNSSSLSKDLLSIIVAKFTSIEIIASSDSAHLFLKKIVTDIKPCRVSLETITWFLRNKNERIYAVCMDRFPLWEWII